MSMPTFPEKGTEITHEQALNMLLGSIAMEELALSHIMNAEGEKLQYFLGTLPNSKHVCATPRDILEVNKSISNLLENVMHNQLLLKGKLAQVIEAKALWAACDKEDTPPASCHRCREEIKCYFSPKEGCWKKGCSLPWYCHGQELCDGVIPLPAPGNYLVEYDFLLSAPKGFVSLVMKCCLGDQFYEWLICSGYAPCFHTPIRITGSVLLPFQEYFHCFPIHFFFSLCQPESVCIKEAKVCLSLQNPPCL